MNYTLKYARELTKAQLDMIAYTHLTMPIEWGRRTNDSNQNQAALVQYWQQTSTAPKIFFVALVSSEDVVMAFLWAESQDEPECHVHIRSIWVASDYRRQGLARFLTAEVEAWARSAGAGWLQTNVHINNKVMQTINREAGYVDTYIRQVKELL